MKKTRKYIISIGAIASVSLPVVTAISCGTTDEEVQYNEYWNNQHEHEVPKSIDRPFSPSEIKTNADWLAFLNASDYDYDFIVRAKNAIDWENHSVKASAFKNLILPEGFVLPSTITSVGDHAFEGATLPVGFTLPESVTTVGEYAFKKTTFSGTVNWPHLSSIGAHAFERAHFMDDVTISGLSFVQQYVFAGATFDGDLLFVNSDGHLLTEIREGAFSGVTFMTDFLLPDSVTDIKSEAFGEYIDENGHAHGTDFFGDFVVSPNSKLTTIGDGAFSGASFAEELEGLDGVTSAGAGIFNGASLPNVPDMPNVQSGSSWNDGLRSEGGIVIVGSQATQIHNFTDLANNSTADKSTQIIASDFDFGTTTTIPDNAFEGYNIQEGFTIPNTITSIGASAFKNSRLNVRMDTGVTAQPGTPQTQVAMIIPNSVTEIKTSAFEDVSFSTGLTFEANSKLTTIGEAAFQSSIIKGALEIPNSVNEIGMHAFANAFFSNDNVTNTNSSVVFHTNRNTRIGRAAFDTARFQGTFIMDGAINEISGRAFENSVLPSGFSLPASVTTIGESAFSNTTFNGPFSISNSVSSIRESAFAYSTFKGIFTLDSKSDLVIGENAFSLSRFIPDGFKFIGSATTIGSNSFNRAQLPTNFTIPSSVTEIGESAFFATSFASDFTLPNTVIKTGDQSFENASFAGNFIVDSAPNLVIGSETFRNARYAATKSLKIQGNMTSVSSNAFRSTTLPDGFTLPSSVVQIEDAAFDSATFSGNFAVPSTVTSIGENAFDNATFKNGITIPNSVTSIGRHAFIDAKLSDGNITINSNVNLAMEQEVFKRVNYNYGGRSTPGTLNINGSMKTLTSEVFKGTTLPVGFTLPTSLTTIETDAFVDATFEGDFTIPNSVTTLETQAFLHSTFNGDLIIDSNASLSIAEMTFKNVVFASGKKLDINGSMTALSARAFKGLTVSILELPATIETIGANAFENSNIGSLNISSLTNLTTLETASFKGATLPVGFTLPTSLTTINDEAFKGATLPVGFRLNDGLTTIGNNVFAGMQKMDANGRYSGPIVPVTLPAGFVIPASVSTLGEGVFSNTILNDDFAINSTTITAIPARTFERSQISANFRLPNGITSLGDHSFSTVSLPTGFTLPTSLTTIGAYAFDQATNVNFDLSTSHVTSIGAYAFSAANIGTSFKLPGLFNNNAASDMSRILEGTFESAILPAGFTVPVNIEYIGVSAFSFVSLPSTFKIGTAINGRDHYGLTIDNYAFMNSTFADDIFGNNDFSGPVITLNSHVFEGVTLDFAPSVTEWVFPENTLSGYGSASVFKGIHASHGIVIKWSIIEGNLDPAKQWGQNGWESTMGSKWIDSTWLGTPGANVTFEEA